MRTYQTPSNVREALQQAAEKSAETSAKLHQAARSNRLEGHRPEPPRTAPPSVDMPKLARLFAIA